MLNCIPEKKKIFAFEQTLLNCELCKDKKKISEACEKCRVWISALQKYADANIPIKYWNLQMSNFVGDSVLSDKYNEITKDIKDTYCKGTTICFAGSHGIGKTMTCANILKRVVEKGFSGIYLNLNDIITAFTSLDKNDARQFLLTVDFLVIDEFDQRYIGSDNAADLFGRILEDIVRIRVQNTLPIIICTNSVKVTDAFQGSLKTSMVSLFNYFKIIPILGNDLRVKGM